MKGTREKEDGKEKAKSKERISGQVGTVLPSEVGRESYALH